MNSVENKKTNISETPVRRKNYRPMILIGIIAVVVIGIIVLIVSNKKGENNQDSSNNQSQEQTKEVSVNVPGKVVEEKKEAEEDRKNDIKEPEEEDYNGKTPTQNEGENPNNLSELTGVINYSEVVEDNLVIRVTIDQYLTSGTCSLEMYSPSTGDSYDVGSEIEPSATTSMCTGFTIPTSSLLEGKYNVTVNINSGDKKGIIKGEVEL